jgi:hypothetical protein
MPSPYAWGACEIESLGQFAYRFPPFVASFVRRNAGHPPSPLRLSGFTGVQGISVVPADSFDFLGGERLLQVTRVGFSARKDVALVGFDVAHRSEHFNLWLPVLKRDSGRWVVVGELDSSYVVPWER